jgi:hypothetical protein
VANNFQWQEIKPTLRRESACLLGSKPHYPAALSKKFSMRPKQRSRITNFTLYVKRLAARTYMIAGLVAMLHS